MINSHLLSFCRFDPHEGFECVNDQQDEGVCQDYKVRYTCPKIFCEMVDYSNHTNDYGTFNGRN